jgi:hypothetical protein
VQGSPGGGGFGGGDCALATTPTLNSVIINSEAIGLLKDRFIVEA